MDNISISVSIPLDDEGYLDRHCPSPECAQPFKVSSDDWKGKVSEDLAYCPFCRHETAAQEYNTDEQNQYLRDAVMAEVQRQLGQMLTGMARDFNRRQPRQSLLSLRMTAKNAPVAIPYLPAAEEQMTLKIACEACGCRAAVIGAGFFCPACGHNSADVMFEQALTKCRAAIEALPAIRQALTDRDQRAQVVQALIENQIGNLVTAFSRYAEASYKRLPHPTETLRRNAFQNLTIGNGFWQRAGGTAFRDLLSPDELDELQTLFQKRHLLEHQQGIVDQDYLTKSGDPSYTLGQRIIIREATVVSLAHTVERLVDGLQKDLGEASDKR